jgi:5-methylcytosine-specific restriction endonuclease McrA
MPVNRMCKSCGRSIIIWNTAQTRCAKCQQARSKAKPPKPISQRGKHALKWASFRKQEAIPYLDKTFGHICSVKGCTETESLDVDHIKGRGSHPHLRYELSNLQYMCRTHHHLKTIGKL